jgi:AraC-like DNA-binding protein
MYSTIRELPLETATRHHAHDFHQIVITLCGTARFEIEGLGGQLDAYAGCIVPANCEHYYSGNPENRQLILDLPPEAPALCGDHRELAALFDAPRFFTLDGALRHYMAFMESELGRTVHLNSDTMRHDRLAVAFLGALMSRLGPSSVHIPKRLNLTHIQRYIERHLAEPLRVADLASLACLSEAHFSTRFRRQTGLSPWQYVRRERLGTARQMILQSALPLTDIALQTGFASQSTLSHAFRRCFGVAPRALRHQAKFSQAHDPQTNVLQTNVLHAPAALAGSKVQTPLKS